jgi:periplasmic protein TonB
MFEDSTFESAGKLRTRSRRWMIATFAFNAAILLALILIPLFYPEALSERAMTWLMTVPPVPVEQPTPVVRPERATVVPTQMPAGVIVAPSVIPKGWKTSSGTEVIEDPKWIALGSEGGAGSPDGVFHGTGSHAEVVQRPVSPKPISSVLAEGLLIQKVIPRYPPIAQEVRLQGTVVLQATISKNGTIENLHVMSGPAMLQQAALDAVAQWRYRPYLLNGEPVEVETTVNVEFKLQ